jgi:hypothetical protein
MTPAELTDLLVARLVRGQGGTSQRWRRLLGSVRLYDVATHPHCNWSINPTGTIPEIAYIERLLDEVRISHPIVQDDR